MSMSIRTNVAAMTGAGQLTRTNKGLTGSLAKISTGMRVNRAADDAAGLGVATNLETQIGSTRTAMRNINDGISIIQTAEGSANEVTDILQRMRELAVQSGSDTLGNDERSFIQDEFVQLRSEVSRIANVTEFNGVALGNGSVSTIDVQVGINNDANSTIAITLGDLTTNGLGISAISLQSSAGALSALAALDTLDTAIGSVNSTRSVFGAVQNRMESALNNSQVSVEALSSANSQIIDTDFATETANLTKLQIMQQAGVAALAQAKNINQSVVSLLN
jgi:flagellin